MDITKNDWYKNYQNQHKFETKQMVKNSPLQM